MKITAITKFKHTGMMEALESLGWTVAELGRRCGITPSMLGSYINLKTRPSKESVDKIEKVIIEAGVDLDIYATWPESFKGFKKRPVVKSTKDIPMEYLISMTDDPLMLGGAITEHNDSVNFMMENMKELDEREAVVIDSLFFKEQTLEECAQEIGRTSERVRGIRDNALMKLSILQEEDGYIKRRCYYKSLPRECYFLWIGDLYRKGCEGCYYRIHRFDKSKRKWHPSNVEFTPSNHVTFIGKKEAANITGGVL